MEKINLLPEELQPGLAIDIRRLVINGIIVLIVFSMLGAYGMFLSRFYTLKNELVEAQAELAKLRPRVAEVEKIRQQRLEMESKVEALSGLIERQKTWSDMLYDLNIIIPVDTWLTGISIYYEPAFDAGVVEKEKENKNENEKKTKGSAKDITQDETHSPNAVTLEGKSRSAASVGVFVNNLNQLPYFTRVKLNGVYENYSEGTVTFSITAAAIVATAASSTNTESNAASESANSVTGPIPGGD